MGGGEQAKLVFGGAHVALDNGAGGAHALTGRGTRSVHYRTYSVGGVSSAVFSSGWGALVLVVSVNCSLIRADLPVRFLK